MRRPPCAWSGSDRGARSSPGCSPRLHPPTTPKASPDRLPGRSTSTPWGSSSRPEQPMPWPTRRPRLNTDGSGISLVVGSASTADASAAGQNVASPKACGLDLPIAGILHVALDSTWPPCEQPGGYLEERNDLATIHVGNTTSSVTTEAGQGHRPGHGQGRRGRRASRVGSRRSQGPQHHAVGETASRGQGRGFGRTGAGAPGRPWASC